jgi:HEAT repeat protein
MTGGEKDRLLSAAQTEQNAELRATAVQQLGVMGAHAELTSLYQKESEVAVKKQIIRAMFVGGNSTKMIELAKSEQNPELRREAIRNLGLMGSRGTGDALVEIYNSDRDLTVRKAVIQALAMNDNAAALVAIARKEQDAALKAEIVRRLSTMNSKVALDYMVEILNK